MTERQQKVKLPQTSSNWLGHGNKDCRPTDNHTCIFVVLSSKVGRAEVI